MRPSVTSAAPSERTRLTRRPQRGAHNRETIDAILDEAISCTLALNRNGHPVAVPTLHARIGDDVYVHGSAASPTLRALGGAVEACLAVTLVDGLVLARSAFHHSVNYRSVMVFGEAERIEEPARKRRALEAFVEKLVPGRWDDVRPPTLQELKATAVLRLPISEASAKIRSGPPIDDEEDYALAAWAGVMPIEVARRVPEPDPRLRAEIEVPAYLGG
jgi:uncharacterized protein